MNDISHFKKCYPFNPKPRPSIFSNTHIWTWEENGKEEVIAVVKFWEFSQM